MAVSHGQPASTPACRMAAQGHSSLTTCSLLMYWVLFSFLPVCLHAAGMIVLPGVGQERSKRVRFKAGVK